MESVLIKELKPVLEPVAIYFTNDKPEGALQFVAGKRGCVASMLVAAAAKGKTAVFDENTYGCPGGGVGLCFGDSFTKDHHPIESLLSTGSPELARIEKSLERGERFFASPELARKFRKEFPYVETGKKYVVFKPLSAVSAAAPPDLLFIFANPDQLSALVIMCGFYRGTMVNVTAPFMAACQTIAYAYREIGKERPQAVMGYFDISQRHNIPKDLLSLTMPFGMFCELERSVPESCLSTEAWRHIAGR